MVLQHISSMSFEIEKDKIVIYYNGLSGEYKQKDIPKEQRELLQKSIENAFESGSTEIRDFIKRFVLDALKKEAKEYMEIFDDLEQYSKN